VCLSEQAILRLSSSANTNAGGAILVLRGIVLLRIAKLKYPEFANYQVESIGSDPMVA